MRENLSPLRTKRKNSLIEIAEDYFIEHGLHNCTMEEIAAASGISRQTMYRYYSSKEDLVFAVGKRVLLRLSSRIEGLFDITANMSLEHLYNLSDKLITILVSEYERELKFTGMLDAYVQHYHRSSHSEEMKELLNSLSNPFNQILKREEDEGNLDSDGIAAELIGETIFNSIFALCQRITLHRETLKEKYGMDPIILVPIQLRLFLRSLIPRE